MPSQHNAYIHDDVYCHPEMIISLEDAELEEWNCDTVPYVQEITYMDEDAFDKYFH